MAESFYTVKPGDSLSKIAKELWGDAKRWPEIFEANRDQIKEPNLIRVGQRIRIPGASVAPAPAASAEGGAPVVGTSGAAPTPAAYNPLSSAPPTEPPPAAHDEPPAQEGRHGRQVE